MLKAFLILYKRMECPVCNTEINDDHAKMTLLCNHTYHTQCMLGRLGLIQINIVRCNVCEELVFPHGNLRQQEEVWINDTDIIENLLDTQPSFNVEIQELRNYWKTLVKTYQTLNKVRAHHLKLFRTQMRDIKDFIKIKSKEKFKEIIKLQEYKDCTKQIQLYSSKIQNFRKKWGLGRGGELVDLERCLMRRGQDNNDFLYRWKFIHSLHRFKYRIKRNFRICII